jgi:hypothetical protein
MRSRSPLTIASTCSLRASGDEVVVLAVSCHRGLLDRVADDRRVSPDALDELSRDPLVSVSGELRASRDQFEFGEREWARDHLDAVVHEPSHHEIRYAPRLPMRAEMNTPGSTTTRIT